ncbi:MAG: cupredoxin domain-containing protein [Bradymonadaceae bacterium]
MTRHLLGTFTLLAALFVAPSVFAGGAADVDRTIDVKATDFKFTPDQLQVESGQTIKIVLHNKGNVAHSFALKRENGEDQKTDKIQPGKTDSFVFTPSETGTIEFVCKVAGHAKIGMRGTIEVVDGR